MPDEPTPRPTALVAGCGDLGTEVALRLAARGEHVLGLRRRIEVLPPEIAGLSVDLTRDRPDLPEGTYDLLAVVLTADGGDAKAYRRTYVDGLARTLDALDARGARPRRAVLVSSSGVYGDTTGPVDETTPVAPSRPTHEILLEAERLFHARLPHGTVLRLAGLYGPGRATFIGRAKAGEVRERWTNRIHRDDAAAAVVHLLSAPSESSESPLESPPPLLLGTDTEPARASEVADFVRHLLGLPGLPARPAPETTSEPPGRRLSSAALRATGFTFAHPTYREGYAAVIGGRGERHP